MKYNFIFLFLLVLSDVTAQKNDNHWALGASPKFSEYRFFYYFGTDAPSSVLRVDTFSTAGYTASYSDDEGNLLCYSNGNLIINRYGRAMENSGGLNPTISDWQTYSYGGLQSGFFLEKHL
jgi:hypothetical protein